MSRPIARSAPLLFALRFVCLFSRRHDRSFLGTADCQMEKCSTCSFLVSSWSCVCVVANRSLNLSDRSCLREARTREGDQEQFTKFEFERVLGSIDGEFL